LTESRKSVAVPLIVIAVLAVSAGRHAYGQCCWPPSHCSASPDAPLCDDQLAVTIGGLWPNSCIPNGSAVRVVGPTIRFDIHRDYPPDVGCFLEITWWSRTESVGPLAPGRYTVVVTLYESGIPVAGPSALCTIEVGTVAWDLDGDGTVDTPDLLELLDAWGTDPGGPPDFDGDGIVATSDLLELLANWGACPK
jgi:hypothetical protein